MTNDREIVLRSWNDTRSLEIKRSYLADGLYAENELCQIFAAAGEGKSTVELQACQAIGSGRRLWGRKTKQMRCIIVDRENSLMTLQERTKALGPAQDVEFWDRSCSTRPPMLDGSEWELYLNLPRPSMVWFDTIRMFHQAEDTDSKAVSRVMDRLKIMCVENYTPVFLNHTPKGNPDTFKGPTTYIDQCDYCLKLSRVTRGKGRTADLTEVLGDLSPKDRYRLGLYQKTRIPGLYGAEILLKFNPDILGFEPMEADTEGQLEAMERLLARFGPLKSGDFLKRAKEEIGISDRRGPELLKEGVKRKIWSIKDGPNNSKVYTLSQSSQFADTNTPI